MAAMATIIFFPLLMISSVAGLTQTKTANQIAPGSSLSASNHGPRLSSWRSPLGRFEFGFYQQANGFAVGIWLVGNGMEDSNTVVWTANREDPPLPPNAQLQLTMNGKLRVQTEQGQEKLIANVTASSAAMLDNGNFVLYNERGNIIWQSFHYPTDTILGGQILPSEEQLTSSSSETNHTSGRFCLKMQKDGNLVLYPTYTASMPSDAYWDSTTFGQGFYLKLNTTGALHIMDSNNSIIFFVNSDSLRVSDFNINYHQTNPIYGATLTFDGNFVLYAHGKDNGTGRPQDSTPKLWSAVKNPCRVKGVCGLNSYCALNDNQPNCYCLPGTEFIDPNNMPLGCKKNFSDAGCTGGNENAAMYTMAKMENLMWGDDTPYFKANMLLEECRQSCLEDCDCGAALFVDDSCKKQKFPLRYVSRIVPEDDWVDSESGTGTGFLKVGNTSLVSGEQIHPMPGQHPELVVVTSSRNDILKIIFVILGFTILLCSTIAISSHLIYKIRVLRYKRLLEIGDLGLNEDVALRIFSYNELKRATNNFKEELGKGSFGAVYKGTLYKGRRLIAVKRLEKLVEEGEREFQAEMRAIGNAHHKNLVRLLGYCAEGSKRLLVYEYMSNGSLGKLLFGAVRRPDWEQRVRIALDVARGILYLHEECEAPIIHCDIKPQNILMDEFWAAKISDFGLAKLLMPDQTRTFTGVRGTRGYLAPEWHKNTPISLKADVYSYGIVLLEIVCCRKNLEIHVSEPEEVVLSSWVYKCFASRELHRLVVGENVDKNVLENMVKVALWCIQDEPALRPTMKSVILMLEGITDIAIPPCPAADSAIFI